MIRWLRDEALLLLNGRGDILDTALPDLINMKLTSGLRDPLRAIDIADVIGLIRAPRLGPEFASRLLAAVRPQFRELARAVQKRG